MKNLNFTIDEELTLLEKYKLNIEELFLIKVLFLTVEENDGSYLKKFFKCSKSNFRDLLISLQNKGVILKSCKIPEKGEVFNPFDLDYNKNFISNIYKSSFELGKELFDEYPSYTNINGNIVTLRSVSKKFNSLEDAYRFYGKAISWNYEIHNEIIELVKWAKDYGILNCSLCSFIVDNKWKDLKELKEGNSSNINFDSVKIL